MLSKLSSDDTAQNVSWFEEEDEKEPEEKTNYSFFCSEYRSKKFCEFDLHLCVFSIKHLRHVKLLNSSSLPVNYDERFYADYLNFKEIQLSINNDGIF